MNERNVKMVKIKWIALFSIIIIFLCIFLVFNQEDEYMNIDNVPQLQVTSDVFLAGGDIPQNYTGYGDDISPGLTLSNICDDAVSIAIIMDDLDHPLIQNYNHWVIWNIPAMEQIPENISYGAVVEQLGGASQGVGYGKHRYRGPKPPIFMKGAHQYTFHVFTLDCALSLDTSSKKKDLVKAMEGHVLQYGSITGVWSNSYLK